MYCNVCGKENQSGSRFCPNCGAQLITPEVFGNDPFEQDGSRQYNMDDYDSYGGQQYFSNNYDSNGGYKYDPNNFDQNRSRQYDSYASDTSGTSKSGGKKKVIIACAAAAAAAAVFIGGFAMNGTTTIDLNEYLSVTYNGYDGYGTAEVTFDTEALADDYEEQLEKAYSKNSSALEKLLGTTADSVGMNVYAEMLESYCISFEADCTDDLSNGDEITVTWTCDDETAEDMFGCSLDYSTCKFTVDGLKEAETFDPFEDIEVSFTGTDTEGKAKYKINSSADEAAEGLTYHFNHSSNLSNGDTVTLTATCSADDVEAYCVENYGVVPSALEKTYTVAGLADEEEETEAAGTESTSVTVIHVTPENGYSYNYINNDNAHYYYDGQLFPDSSYVKLTQSEVSSLTDDELQDAINEIYARNGYIFNTESILEYYSQFAWYVPTYESEYFSNHLKSILNSVELANVNLLAKERDSR